MARLAVNEPVKDFHGAALKGCDECADFSGDRLTSRWAAWAPWTVDQCQRAHRAGAWPSKPRDPMDVRGLDDPPALLRLDTLDKEIAERPYSASSTPRPLFIDFEEHVRVLRGIRPQAGLHPPLTVISPLRPTRTERADSRAQAWLSSVLDGSELSAVLMGRGRARPVVVVPMRHVQSAGIPRD